MSASHAYSSGKVSPWHMRSAGILGAAGGLGVAWYSHNAALNAHGRGFRSASAIPPAQAARRKEEASDSLIGLSYNCSEVSVRLRLIAMNFARQSAPTSAGLLFAFGRGARPDRRHDSAGLPAGRTLTRSPAPGQRWRPDGHWLCRRSAWRRRVAGVAGDIRRRGRRDLCEVRTRWRTRVEGVHGRQLAAGNDEDVDAGRTGLLDSLLIGPPTAMCHQLRWMGPITIWVISCCRAKPTMARAGSSIFYLVPAGAQIGCQFAARRSTGDPGTGPCRRRSRLPRSVPP